MRFYRYPLIISILFLFSSSLFALNLTNGIAVLETDFGLKDSAVSEMKGVMYSIDKSLLISDMTHEIPPFNIWEAAYRLFQVEPYWSKGTVFVIVVDPGVGTARKSIVALSKDGNYFVTPDNGILTLIEDSVGIQEVREIDETKNRLPGSLQSHTFYGRDVFGYTAARLAAGKISFEEVGPKLSTPLLKISYQKSIIENQSLKGMIVSLDRNYGNVWSNIDGSLVKKFNMRVGKNYRVRIFFNHIKKFEADLPYCNTFGEVKAGENLLYINSLFSLSIGSNQGNFARQNHIGAGSGWTIEIEKID